MLYKWFHSDMVSDMNEQNFFYHLAFEINRNQEDHLEILGKMFYCEKLVGYKIRF